MYLAQSDKSCVYEEAQVQHYHRLKVIYTVDGKDLEPPGMYETLNMLRGATYQGTV